MLFKKSKGEKTRMNGALISYPETLTASQVLQSKANRFFNVKKNKTVSGKKAKLLCSEIIIIDNNPNAKTVLIELPPNKKRYDKRTGVYRLHETSCEFGKHNCSCWCEDEYHGIGVLI